jgi:beta-galactosidase
VVHILPHWNWPGREGQDVRVWVHANVDEVELLLNGTSLGRQRVTPNAHLAWQVPYAPGTLEARGFTRGQQVLVDRRETTGAPSAITLTPDRATIDANGEDVSVIVVRVVDAQGRVVPVAGDEIEFTVSGAGTLIGLGNGDPSDHTPDKGTVRRAFNGLCMAIVQSGRNAGTITIRAAADGLAPALVDIACRSATLRPSLP